MLRSPSLEFGRREGGGDRPITIWEDFLELLLDVLFHMLYLFVVFWVRITFGGIFEKN